MASSRHVKSVTAIVRKSYFVDYKNVSETFINFNINEPFKNLEYVDHIFCCLGSTRRKAISKEVFRFIDFYLSLAFAKWAKRNNCKSFSLVTSMGADSSSTIFTIKQKERLKMK